MKKLIAFLLIASAFMLSACHGTSNHPVSGNVYFYHFNNDYHEYILQSYSFKSNGNCSHLYFIDSGTTTYDHLYWDAAGNSITITRDNSLEWKAEYRGKVLETLTYNPTDNTLTSGSGKIYFPAGMGMTIK